MLNMFNPCANKVLKVSIAQSELLKLNKKDGVWTLNGFEGSLIKALSATLNFTYELNEVKIGGINENDEWTGLFKNLLNNETDIGLAFMKDSYKSRTIVDFSTPYFEEHAHFYIGQQQPNKRGYFLSMTPFQNDVYWTLLCCLVVIILFLRLIVPKNFTDKWWAFPYIIGILLHQNNTINDRSLPAVVIITSWILACTVLIIFYGNMLKALSSVSVQNIDKLSDLSDMFASGQLKIASKPQGFFSEFIENLPATSKYGQIYRDAIEWIQFKPENLTNEFFEQYALIGGGDSGIMLTSDKTNVKYHKVKEPLFYYNVALGFSKAFQCNDAFNNVIRYLQETGFLLKWEKEMILLERRVNGSSSDSVTYIRLRAFRSTFFIAAILIVLSIMVLILEMTLFNPTSSRPKYRHSRY